MNQFEEYKFFTERVQNHSARRQQVSQTYLTLNTAILSILALLLSTSSLQGWNLALAALPLVLVGVLVCVVWRKTIANYKRVIGWQYEQLRELEGRMEDCFHMHTKEWERFYSPAKRFTFSDLEALMPAILVILYVVYGVGLMAAVYTGTV